MSPTSPPAAAPPTTHVYKIASIPPDILPLAWLLASLPEVKLFPSSRPHDRNNCICHGVQQIHNTQADSFIKSLFPMPDLQTANNIVTTAVVKMYEVVVYFATLIWEDTHYSQLQTRGSFHLTLKHLYAQLILAHPFLLLYGLHNADIGFPWLTDKDCQPYLQKSDIHEAGPRRRIYEENMEIGTLVGVIAEMSGLSEERAAWFVCLRGIDGLHNLVTAKGRRRELVGEVDKRGCWGYEFMPWTVELLDRRAEVEVEVEDEVYEGGDEESEWVAIEARGEFWGGDGMSEEEEEQEEEEGFNYDIDVEAWVDGITSGSEGPSIRETLRTVKGETYELNPEAPVYYPKGVPKPRETTITSEAASPRSSDASVIDSKASIEDKSRDEKLEEMHQILSNILDNSEGGAYRAPYEQYNELPFYPESLSDFEETTTAANPLEALISESSSSEPSVEDKLRVDKVQEMRLIVSGILKEGGTIRAHYPAPGPAPLSGTLFERPKNELQMEKKDVLVSEGGGYKKKAEVTVKELVFDSDLGEQKGVLGIKVEELAPRSPGRPSKTASPPKFARMGHCCDFFGWCDCDTKK